MDDLAISMPKREIERFQRCTQGSVQMGRELLWWGAVTVPEDGTGLRPLELTRRGIVAESLDACSETLSR